MITLFYSPSLRQFVRSLTDLRSEGMLVFSGPTENLTIAFVAPSGGALALVGATGVFAVAKQSDVQSILALSAAWELSEDSTSASLTLDVDTEEARAALQHGPSNSLVECLAQLVVTELDAEPAHSRFASSRILASIIRPDGTPPSVAADAIWAWLKLRELAGEGIQRVVDESNRTLTWSAPEIATNAAAIAAEATARATADITLQTNIDGKAATIHSHAIADVTGLQTALDAKAASADLATEAATRADADNNLQTAINGKANTAHTHTLSNITQSGATAGQVPVWSGTAWTPGSASFPRGHIAGLKLANNVSTLLDIGEGVCRDESNSSNIVLASGLTRDIAATWNVGNGGLQPGLTLTASRWYSVWALGAVGFNVGDVMFSDSATSPVVPLPYNTRRRIGWIWVNASSQITPFLQVGEQVTLNTGNTTADVITAMSGVDTLITLPAPPNTDVMLRAWSSATSGTYKIRIDPTSVSFPATPTTDTSTINGSAGTVGGNIHLNMMTDANSQIHAINSGGSSLSLRLTVRGWIDNRGRFD